MYRSIIILLTAVLVLPFTALGQEADSMSQSRKWYVPDAAVIQYAGNMGMLSAGPGYDLAKKKIALDLLFGYVPKFEAEEIGRIISLKATYKPFRIALNEKYTLIPVQGGLGVSYHFGDQFSTSWEGPIPKGYYWWPTSWRVLGFAGAAINRKIEDSTVKNLELYGGLGTYDLVTTAWYRDDRLTLWDIMSASAGVRISF